MQDHRAARRYAKALFEVALERKLMDPVERDLSEFVSLVQDNAEFRSFYQAPNFSREQKLSVINEIFESTASKLSLELLKMMIDSGRSREVTAVRDEFVRLRQQHSGIVSATITSSVPLGDAEKSQLLDKLQIVIGKKIEADYEIDPRILGGVRVVYDNNSIDASVKGALEIMRQQFHHDVLKQA